MKVLASIIYKMKDGFSNTRSVSYWTNWLADCFDQEIKVCDESLVDLEKIEKNWQRKRLMLSLNQKLLAKRIFHL